jgi:hypothetical protein
VNRAPARRAGAWAGLVLLAAAGLPHAAADLDVPQLLWNDVMTPATARAAAAAKFPVERMELRPGVPPPPPAAGDQVVALVSLVVPNAPPTQWLLRVAMADAGNAAAAGRDRTLYTSVGDAFVFHSAAPAAMDLDILGPVVAGQAVGAHRHRVAASPDYLMLDLGRAAEAMHHIHEAAHTVPGTNHSFGASPRPFPPAQVAANQAYMAPFHLTVEERRSFAGSIPALTEFLNLVQATPGLQDILLQVLEQPSVLDVMRHGLHPDFNFQFRQAVPVALGDPSGALGDRLPAGHGILIDLQLYGKPVLTVALVVTAPRPPLEVSAGIIGVVAWGPNHPDKAVVIRALASRFSRTP